MAVNINFGVSFCISCMRQISLTTRMHSVTRMVSSAASLHAENENDSVGVDIGLPAPQRQRRTILRERAAVVGGNRKQADLEAKARHRTLKIPLDKVSEVWEETSGPYHIRAVAHHYGIYRDLFDGADFTPYVPLKIAYRQEATEAVPVYRGNFVTPTESSSIPDVSYEAPGDSLWTVLMTNPDGHLLDNEAEYAHWLIGNIPENRLSEGEMLLDYLPPFPARGTGYHRFIFILFKQNERIAFTEEKHRLPSLSLAERTFRTLEFYKMHQDVITPAGLGFFQSRWDPSVQHTFHHALAMREPVFEYDHPELYIAPQVKWPRRKPIQYLKKYLPKE